MLMPRDAHAVKGVRLRRETLRRAWRFSAPYKWRIIGFLSAICGAAALGLVPPLLFRSILDDAIPAGNRGLITTLAGVLVVAAVGDAALAIVQRWLSASIGEGLIYDLRVALFDKVQRMPVDFFTRTQTGALISRLNNDVVGAQTAVTSTLGSVVSNMVVLAFTLTAMFALEWRLTLLSLVVLPLFIAPARRVGARLGAIAHEQMEHNAAMNAQMSERFNVAGAILVKLFGRRASETEVFAARARGVRDTGIKSALYGRIFFVALGLVGAMGAAAIYGVGAHLVVDGSISAGTLVAMASFITRVYQPLTGLTNARVEVMTAFVSFDRV
jgi:ATP-binding cassette subfamily B protein